MTTININHTQDCGTAKTLSSTVLAVAVMLLMLSLFWLQQNSASLSQLKSQQTQLNHDLIQKQIAPVLTDDQKAEKEAIDTAISEIRRPWPQLFAVLENALIDSVHLLSMDPDMNSRTVNIEAVTGNVDGILKYATSLKQQRLFERIRLVSTRKIRLDGQSRIQFEFLLNW